MAADGSYTYDPHSIPGVENLALGAHPETFNYSIADGHGDVSSSTLTITVNIDPETVTANVDTNAVSDDSTLTVNAANGVLANDVADADDQSTLLVTTTGNLTGSLGGTLVMAADGSYTYDPHSIPGVENLALGAHPETFNYSIADGHGDVSSSTLTITVNIDPETVTANVDTNAVSDDSTLTVNAANGVLANDVSDGDDALHVTTTGNLTGSLGGTLVMAGGGYYKY